MKTQLFFYGTLKRGCSNHAQMEGQEFVGLARTVAGFTLYDLGGYPAIVADPGDRNGVVGEVWRVDDEGLERLDRFEGVHEGLYRREAIALQAPFAERGIDAYVSVLPVNGRPQVGSGGLQPALLFYFERLLRHALHRHEPRTEKVFEGVANFGRDFLHEVVQRRERARIGFLGRLASSRRRHEHFAAVAQLGDHRGLSGLVGPARRSRFGIRGNFRGLALQDGVSRSRRFSGRRYHHRRWRRNFGGRLANHGRVG